ncbi:MAG: c-type cytochrome [Methylotenera sp.]
MSNKDDAYKGSTFWQLIIAIPGSILAFTLLISLIAKTSSTVGVPEVAEPAAVVALAVEENIKPVAAVEVAAADAGPIADKSGEEVYKSVCMMCHDTGLMAAPKFGDKAQWAPRIAQGYETLVSHAINGIRTMPAKGGNAVLTDGEIYNAVAHMANAAGADFKAPSPKAAEPAAVAPVAAVSGKSGEEVYKSVCMMCHDTGLMAAPKFGDKSQWAPRIAQGYDTLVTHAVKGVRNMPAKGGNPGLSDAEVAGAVKYMADAAGAKF